MNRRISAILTIALLSPTLSWAACDVKSGPKTTALVELYTSEGCSSCPPADKRLSQLPSRDWSLEQVVPISLHVHRARRKPAEDPRRQGWILGRSRLRMVGRHLAATARADLSQL